MRKIRIIFPIIIAVIVFIISIPYITYKLTDDIDISVSAVPQRVVCCNGEYFYKTPQGIFKCNEPSDTLVAEGSYDSFYVDNKRIYCCDMVKKKQDKINTVYVFDKLTGVSQGSFQSTEGLEGSIKDGIMCVSSIQKVTNKSVLRFYDIFNDFKEVPVVYDRKLAGDATVFEFTDGRDSVVVSDSIYNQIISVTDDYIICSDTSNDASIVFNYRDLSMFNKTHVGKLDTACDTDNGLYISCTQNKSFFWENKNFSRTDLKHNKFDTVKIIEQRSGKTVPDSSHSFRRTERVLRYDKKFVITYHNGNYIYYDSENFKEIQRIKADEIVDGGSYHVESYGNITFIFSGDKLVKKLYT